MPRFLNLDVESFARFTRGFSLDLNRRGLVLVEGENRDSGDAFDSNGAGKSMLFEALTWALTGKMARYGDERIGGDEVCYGEHGATVTACFETQRGTFSARRSRRRTGSPSLDLRVLDAYHEYIPLQDAGINAALATDDLSTLLGFDYRTLRNAIFLQGTGLDVASSTFAKQMKLLESVLRFDDLTRAAKYASERAKALELEAREKIGAMNTWLSQRQMAEHTIRELETLDESGRESELVERIREARGALSRIGAIDRAAAVKSLREAQEQYATAQAEYKHAQAHLESMRSLDAKCDVCQSELPQTRRDALVHDAVHVAADAKNLLTQSEEAMSRRQTHADEITATVEFRDGLQRQLHNDERELQDIRTRASRRLGVIQAQTVRLTEAEQHIAQLTNEIGDTRRNIALAQTWSKRGFDELKAEILGAAAPVLNAAADHYTAILSDGSLRVEFATLREVRSENLLRLRRGGDVCAYESLSNGERRRVDLTVALALRACARWRIAEPINLSVWDEVFDKLDESGMRRAIEVLQRDLSELETVFVITHSAAFRTMFSGARTLHVIREHGVSRVEQ